MSKRRFATVSDCDGQSARQMNDVHEVHTMYPMHESLLQARRNFLVTSASGIGILVRASLLEKM